MRGLRFHLSLITIISLLCLVWGAARGVSLYKTWNASNEELQYSLTISQEISGLRGVGFNNQTHRRLQKLRADMQPKERRDLMSNIIQSVKSRSSAMPVATPS